MPLPTPRTPSQGVPPPSPPQDPLPTGPNCPHPGLSGGQSSTPFPPVPGPPPSGLKLCTLPTAPQGPLWMGSNCPPSPRAPSPWMLSIWPSLSAAPRTLHSVRTMRSALASDRKGLESSTAFFPEGGWVPGQGRWPLGVSAGLTPPERGYEAGGAHTFAQLSPSLHIGPWGLTQAPLKSTVRGRDGGGRDGRGRDGREDLGGPR